MTPNPFIPTSLFEGVLIGGKPHFLEEIWDQITYFYATDVLSEILDHRVLQSFMVGICRMQRYYQFRHHLLCDVWDLMVRQLGIETTIHCHCIAMLVLSKYGRNGPEFELFIDLYSDQKMMDQIECQSVEFRQALTALNALGMNEEKWNLYHRVIAKSTVHDVYALCTIGQSECDLDKLQMILEIVGSEFVLNQLALYFLMALHGVAIESGDDMMRNDILQILNVDIGDLSKQIVARFKMNGKQWILRNGLDEQCLFGSNEKVDAVMADSGYIFEKAVGNEIFNEEAQTIHLKYHAEKRALCVLLADNDSDRDGRISVSVSIAMCADSHKFFQDILLHFRGQIESTVPTGTRLFDEGVA